MDPHIDQLLRPPDLQPSRPNLTIVFGPAGGGKSTYVAQHAKPGDTIIDLDAIRAQLEISESDWSAAAMIRSLGVRNTRLRELATSDAPGAWFIVSAAASSEREWWRNVLQPSAHFVVLASVGVCTNRIITTRRGDRMERSLLAAKSWWSQFVQARDDALVTTDCGH